MNKKLHLIILPGNDSVNKIWAEKARDFFAPYFKSTIVQYYDHWSDSTKSIDIDVELKKLINTVNSIQDQFVIFAKSVGTLLTMYMFYLKSIDQSRITKCVFVGLPLKWARVNKFNIDDWSVDYTVPTILIQNDRDPVTPIEEIIEEQVGGKFTNMILVKMDGDDHVYDNFDDIKRYLI